MSDAPDKDSKTEQATEKRREEALDRGNTPVSREVSHLGFVFALMAAGAWMALGASGRISAVLTAFVERPGEIHLRSAADVSLLLRALIQELAPLLAPLPVVIVATGLLFQAMQTPFRFSWKRIEPQASRISMAQGWKRIASVMGLADLAKGLLKLGFLGGVGAWYLLTPHETLRFSLDMPFRSLPSLIVAACAAVLMPVAIAVAFLAISDLAFTRMTWARNLRMTRQEVRDEAKQAEGDQALAFRRRSIARARVRQMMITSVPRATLVVANPTHFAVALRYVRSEGGAPLVVAKGRDVLALQIRRIAEENGIPVVEDKGLARSLYAAVEVNQAISKEFYAAIANIMLMLRRIGNRHVTKSLEG